MKYMVDEMIENVAETLRADGFDCRTVYEWIDGTKEKKRKIDDAEIRKFLRDRKSNGEEVTLITCDLDSWRQVSVDDLDVIYVPHVVREHVRKLNARS